MPSPKLDADQLKAAWDLIKSVNQQIEVLAAGDASLRFAFTRKVWKELCYAERGSPMDRRKLKAQKRADQGGICPLCGQPLPRTYAVLDRRSAVGGYTAENTQLICEKCDREIQAGRRFS